MKISLTTLGTKELATLAERIINASKSGKYRVIENHELLLALIAVYAVYNGIYIKLSFSGKGVLVAEADKKRDALFNQIKALLKAIADIVSLPTNQAAVDILEIIKIYGMSLHEMNYAAETARMKKLIEALETEENQAKLTALGIAPLFAELKQAQTDFEAIYAEQAEANAELRTLPSASVARKDLEKALRDYLNLLTAMRNVSDWKLLYAEINELVKGVE